MSLSPSCETNMQDYQARFVHAATSDHQSDRMLDEMPEGGKQLGAEDAVDDTAIARQRDRHLTGEAYPSVRGLGRPSCGGPNRENRRVGRINDGGEFLDAMHAKIGNRRDAALNFGGLELAHAGTGGQILHLG